MEVTDVRVIMVDNDDKLKAFVTVELERSLVVRDLKVISGDSGVFVAMPAKKMKDGSFKDIAYASNMDLRKKIENAVIEEYKKVLEKLHSKVA
ncbi:MAG: septation regulator SpoVG [Deltaproteobacteria bacterium]|nr:septation regulator SpoVG [Deltaproteobacteria bacterium]